MSKFMQKLVTQTTGRVFPEPLKSLDELMSVKQDVVEPMAYSNYMEYRTEVRIGTTFIAKDAEQAKINEENVRHLLADAIFGEYRTQLYKAIVAIRRDDRDKAYNILNDMMESMFDITGEV